MSCILWRKISESSGRCEVALLSGGRECKKLSRRQVCMIMSIV